MAVKILLDHNPRGRFYIAGDKITGRAIISSSSKKTLQRATVTCFANERASIKYGGWHYFPNHTHFSLVSQLIQKPQEIPEGDTILTFSFQLPYSTRVARLAPVRAVTGHGVFEIENAIEFSVKFDTTFGSTDSCKIPIPIGPIWNPDLLHEKDRGDFPEHSGVLESCCDCFSNKTHATIKLSGVPQLSCSSGRITQPMKIYVKCAEDNAPKNITISLVGETKINQIHLSLTKTTYYYKSKPWGGSKAKEDGFFVLQHDAKFEVKEYELLTARAFCWTRSYNWEIDVDFQKGGSLKAVFEVVFGFLDSGKELSPPQKDLAVFAYYTGSENYTVIVSDKVADDQKKNEVEDVTQEQAVTGSGSETKPAGESQQDL